MTLPVTQHHLQPKHQRPSLDFTAKHYLFIAEEGALPLLQPLLNAIESPLKKSLVVTDLDISPVTTNSYQLISNEKADHYAEAFLLANAKDAAVYIAGTKRFSSMVHNLALKTGVAKGRIHMLEPISDLRHIICTHCFTTIDNVSETMTTCSGCQRQLEVQDKYSDVHGAYLASSTRRTQSKANANQSESEALF